MVQSMTGYGRKTHETDSFSVTAELKSVNHRFSEITVYLPHPFHIYEDQVRRLLAQYITRGKVDARISIEGDHLYDRELTVDWDLLQQYVDFLQEAGNRFSLPRQLTTGELLQVTEAFASSEKECKSKQLEEVLLQVVKGALDQLLEMRKTEGNHLNDDLHVRLNHIESALDTIKTHAPKVTERYRERLREHVRAFMEDHVAIDEARLLNEVAVFSDKANIDEELTRLMSHIGQFRKYLSEEGAIGRKLDFLLQEMNREINTIGAKGNDFDISVQVVEVKSELEKLKEQVQNIE